MIWAFVANIFAKQYILSENFNFQWNFHIFTVLQLQSLSRWIINEWLWIFLETINENLQICWWKGHMSQLIGFFLSWEISANSLAVIIDHTVTVTNASFEMLILKEGTQHWGGQISVKYWSIFKIKDLFEKNFVSFAKMTNIFITGSFLLRTLPLYFFLYIGKFWLLLWDIIKHVIVSFL